ncbi:uncharacterized protein LOC113665625 isoform X2 [Pocillopora damicornis]|uniref:uncharacterized protein LOC113665625 isoform X2 n=1 Tax=Pocillopora damicornis TaxID=46731 RepID=UPI000F558977|nr:uncharacterized protein LOC113665625 isoform X2 [Pocillopora damicornis]
MQINMAESRKSWLQFLSVILVVLLLLEAAESRPPKKGKKKSRAKQCGNEGHLCQSGSRKLCCSAGFTCHTPIFSRNKTRKLKRRKKLGMCKPIKPQEKEIDESQKTPSFRFSTKPTVFFRAEIKNSSPSRGL